LHIKWCFTESLIRPLELQVSRKLAILSLENIYFKLLFCSHCCYIKRNRMRRYSYECTYLYIYLVYEMNSHASNVMLFLSFPCPYDSIIFFFDPSHIHTCTIYTHIHTYSHELKIRRVHTGRRANRCTRISTYRRKRKDKIHVYVYHFAVYEMTFVTNAYVITVASALYWVLTEMCPVLTRLVTSSRYVDIFTTVNIPSLL